MGAGQSACNPFEAMLGACGIADDVPSRTDEFFEPGDAALRTAALAKREYELDEKSLDEKLAGAIALAAAYSPLLDEPVIVEAEGAEGAEEAEGAEGAEEGAEGAESDSDSDSSDSDTASESESELALEKLMQRSNTIASCARAMGYGAKRLFPVTAATVARAIGAGHAVVAATSDEVLVMHGCTVVRDDSVERFTATSFGGESREIGAEELRYLFGFWTVQAPPARGAGAAE